MLLRLLLSLLVVTSVAAQDAREALGPKDGKAKNNEPHALSILMRERHSKLRPELRGQHPRVYATDEELKALRERAKTTHKDLWQRALANVRALKVSPAAPPAACSAPRSKSSRARSAPAGTRASACGRA